MNLKVVTVIQARTGSSRFPDKVLMPLAGKPLLVRMAERVMSAGYSGTVVVATTTDASDDVIVNLCSRENISVFRGHPDDLLDRHYKTAIAYGADTVVKIPSDCPLIDPGVIDKVIEFYLSNQNSFDFVSNLHPATYPDGNDVEIMNMMTLYKAWKNAAKPMEREHTTPFIWDNPGMFRIGNVYWEKGKDYSMSHRFTIDYREDYLLIKNIYDELYDKDPLFGLDMILKLLEEKPHLKLINLEFNGVNWYRNHLNELKTVSDGETKHLNIPVRMKNEKN